MNTTTRFLAPLSAALVACAGGHTGPGPTTPAAEVAPDTAAPPTSERVAFSAMSRAQRLAHMKQVVRPEMGDLFRRFDAVKYADFGCPTCHGKGEQDTHKFLPPLKFSGGAHAALEAEKPVMMKFMIETVAPAMADKMREPRYDGATRKGFGCGGCHKIT